MSSSNVSSSDPHPLYHVDTLSSIASHLLWKNLIRWYVLGSTAVDVVQLEIRRRVFSAVSSFIPEDCVHEFFDVLRDSDGLICGSIARRILLPYEPQTDDQLPLKPMPAPHDLNVLIALDRVELLFDYFSSLSYENSVEPPAKLYEACVTKIDVFTKIEGDGSASRITISHCKEGPLSALLNSPTTSEMNAITHDAIYSVYPRLTYANESLIAQRITSAGIDHDDLKSGGEVQLFVDNTHWTTTCGPYCPMGRRKTYGDSGVACYRWSPIQSDLSVINKWGNKVEDEPARAQVSEWDLFYSVMETWKILDRCVNPFCEHSLNYERRRQFALV